MRLAAVEALANTDEATRQRYLPPLLEDPVRAVRIEAALALVRVQLSERSRAAFDKSLAEYEAVQIYNADRPEGHLNLGNLHAQRGKTDQAIAAYRKALVLDPTFIAAYANLADLHRARGAEGDAEVVLRAGLARNPGAAALHHALGLSLVRSKRKPESLRALRDAANLDPANARFAYVYAVALNDNGQRKEALKVLDTALMRHPNDRGVLSALAYFSPQSGKRELSLGYLRKLSELDPENPEYAQRAKQIESAR